MATPPPAVVEPPAYYRNPPMHQPGALSSVPSYSSLPLTDEETVQYTPRQGAWLPSEGTFTRKWDLMTLTLHGQSLDVRRPTYHLHGNVAGEIELNQPERVLAVTVKLEGRIALSVSDVGAQAILTAQEEVVVWKSDEREPGQCPEALLFSLRMPSSFVDSGKSWKLPPSFEASFIRVPAIFSRCTYSLSISLERVVRCGPVSWVKEKTYNTLINYQPRKRPSCPMPRFDSVFSSMKQLPGDWTQLTATMRVQPGSTMKALDCHFIVPTNSSCSLSDGIPFHIQLLGSVETLKELLPPSSIQQPTQDRDTNVTQDDFAIQVYIARQVAVEILGRKTYRTLVIGTGTMWPVPPTDLEYGSSAPDNACLDWEGEAKCFKEVTCGGFHAGGLHVNDFIVLALHPPLTKTVPLLPVQITHPVKFVTDPWVETDMAHPYDY